MESRTIPGEIEQLLDVIVPAIRRAYEINSERHDAMVGDDTSTFGFTVYRNSWHLIEEAVRELDGWSASRPEGSLVITNGHYRVHVYRAGSDEFVDLDALRFDRDTASNTKRSIAGSNSQQLAFAFDFEAEEIAAGSAPDPSNLHEVVVLHAGNPDDALCAIWLGAPVTNDRPSASPWAWRDAVMTVHRSEPRVEQASNVAETPRHDELPEPDLDLSPVVAPERDARQQ